MSYEVFNVSYCKIKRSHLYKYEKGINTAQKHSYLTNFKEDGHLFI